MLRSSSPTKFLLAWAANAGGSFIRTVPVASQIGVNAGAASYNDGFVPDNFTQIAAGGVPPFGQDMNGVLNETTTWDQWYQAGAPITYDSAFSAAIGGYPLGAVLQSNVTLGKRWMSTIDNNTTDPDSLTSAANWVTPSGDVPTGTPLQSLSSTLPYGYVAGNGLTIGNASSNASGRANADTQFLFSYNWTSFSNSACPIFDSTGAPSIRGANPAADFAANKALATPVMKGLGLMGADTMGGSSSTFLTGVPITSGNATTPGSILGENIHVLNASEAPIVAYSTVFTTPPTYLFTATSIPNVASTAGVNAMNAGTTTLNTGGGILQTTSNAGGSGHNTAERNMIVYWGQKL